MRVSAAVTGGMGNRGRWVWNTQTTQPKTELYTRITANYHNIQEVRKQYLQNQQTKQRDPKSAALLYFWSQKLHIDKNGQYHKCVYYYSFL